MVLHALYTNGTGKFKEELGNTFPALITRYRHHNAFQSVLDCGYRTAEGMTAWVVVTHLSDFLAHRDKSAVSLTAGMILERRELPGGVKQYQGAKL